MHQVWGSANEGGDAGETIAYDEGKDESQDQGAKVGGGEGQPLGREDVLEVRQGTLEDSEAAGEEAKLADPAGRAEVSL